LITFNGDTAIVDIYFCVSMRVMPRTRIFFR